MPLVLAPIIEGHGEVNAIRVLINKVLVACDAIEYPVINDIWRLPSSKLVNPDQLEATAEKAIRQAEILPDLGAPNKARLIVLFDSDDDCPARLGPFLRERLIARFPDNPVSVSLANREYENWLIASLETIAEAAGIPPSASVPYSPEDIRGAKEWLSRQIPRGTSYKPQKDQARLTASIDVPLARQRSQSFDRFCREVERLLAA